MIALSGPRLVAASAVLVTAMSAFILLAEGTGEAGVREVVRATARTSAVFFCAAFGAAALQRLFPGPVTMWMRRNRRYLGLSLAASHTVHLLAVGALVAPDPAGFVAERGGFASQVPALFAVAMLVALAVTSNDVSVRRLGERRWRMLHLSAGYVVFVAFLVSFSGRVLTEGVYAVFTALLLATLGLRAAAAVSVRRARRVVAAETP